MIICTGCKHQKSNMWCKSPHNVINPVDGEPFVHWASINRREGCGEFALWFER